MASRARPKRSRSPEAAVSPPPVKRKQQSLTTQKAVASFFTPASQKEQVKEKITWRVVSETLLVGCYESSLESKAMAGESGRKIAAFDFDSTLITSASGLKFARDATDWKWWHASVPTTLKRLHEEGYLVAILSNQGGISLKADPKSKTAKTDQKRLADFKRKGTAVLSQLDFPLSIYAATDKDHFRKPRTGMWQCLLEDNHLKTPEDVDLEKSIFVGDAGGREANSAGAGKDFSCSDRNFAANVGIPYRSPEEFFLNEDPKPFRRTFVPSDYTEPGMDLNTDATPIAYEKKNALDIVIACGSPGAGKSTFYWRNLKPLGYERVNQDILKTRDRCLQVARDFLKQGKSVAVDNTNAEPTVRAVWVALAKDFKVPIRCVLLTTPPTLCEHNDTVRALNASVGNLNPEKRTMLPRVAFAGFASRFREPKLDEGFQDIVKVDFAFNGNDEEKQVWSRYWI